MKHFIATLFGRKENNAVKILLLALGLAMGLVLIAKVYYERAYDNFMDDVLRTYSAANANPVKNLKVS